MTILILKVSKSIDFAMFLVRVCLTINIINLITIIKTMIMKKIESIKNILKRTEIMNFIKSMVIGVTFVEKDGQTSDYKT